MRGDDCVQMRKIFLMPGVALFIIGILVVSSVNQLVDSTSVTGSHFYSHGVKDEFISQALSITRENVLIVFFNETYQHVYLIPSPQSLYVNNTTAAELAVMPVSNGNVTKYGLTYSLNSTGAIYDNLTGHYNIVVFAGTPAGITYYLLNAMRDEQLTGEIELAGFSAMSAGIAGIIAGTVLGPRKR